MICLQKNVETLETLDFFPFIVFSSTLESFGSPDTDYLDAGDVSRGPRVNHNVANLSTYIGI
jgi:hypothetical protein